MGPFEGKGVEFDVFAGRNRRRGRSSKKDASRSRPASLVAAPGNPIQTATRERNLRRHGITRRVHALSRFLDGPEGLHRDSGEIVLAVEAEVFEEDVRRKQHDGSCWK